MQKVNQISILPKAFPKSDQPPHGRVLRVARMNIVIASGFGKVGLHFK